MVQKFTNSHFQYILTAIDSYSRYAWCVPIKNKTSKACKEALELIFSKKRRPQIIYSDLGNEFKGDCIKFLNELGIRHIHSKSKLKASLVERFNRTIKQKIYRFFTFSNKKRFVDVLEKLTHNYNNSIHSSIKERPANIDLNYEKKN